jgi:hypothetical protein
MRSAVFLASLGLVASVCAKHTHHLHNYGQSRVRWTTRSPSNSTLVDPAQSKHFVHFDCGTNVSYASDHLLNTHKVLHADSKSDSAGAKLRARAIAARQALATPVQISTVFHIVSSSANAGTVTPAMPDLQIAALSKMYNPIGFFFNLINTTWTTNDAWVVGTGSDMDAMKQTLRQGSYSTLNIYFQSDLAGSILGVCSMPSQLDNPSASTPLDPSQYTSDGCSVNSGTMPGGSIYGYSAGMTAVHETGHWFLRLRYYLKCSLTPKIGCDLGDGWRAMPTIDNVQESTSRRTANTPATIT